MKMSKRTGLPARDTQSTEGLAGSRCYVFALDVWIWHGVCGRTKKNTQRSATPERRALPRSAAKSWLRVRCCRRATGPRSMQESPTSRRGTLGTGTGTRTCCPFLGLEERHTDPPARRGCLVTARRLESISVPRSRSRELIGRSSSDISRSCRSPRSDLPRPARFSVNTRRVQSFALWIIKCITS